MFCNTVKRKWRLKSLIISNLIIGYTIALILFLIVPPHTHTPISFNAEAQISNDGNFAAISYHDPSRFWPWSNRIFLSHTDVGGQPAQEIYWYQKTPFLSSLKLPAHLSIRPNASWFSDSKSNLLFLPIIELYPPTTDNFFPKTNAPRIILFYSEDCAPCHIEMKNLIKIKEKAKEFEISILALSSLNKELESALKELGISIYIAPGNLGKTILRTYQKTSQQLPYSLAFDRGGKICASRLGILGTDIIQKWRQSCLS